MKKSAAPDEEQRWFEQNISGELRKFDSAYEREAPDTVDLELFVAQHQRDLRKRLWRDLMILWLVAACLLLGMLWVMDRHFMWFVSLQAISAAGAVVFIGVSHRKKVRGIWKNG